MYSAADGEIVDVSITRPHVVILGAGASCAACPNGDRNGRKLPVMANFIQVLGLEHILEKHGIEVVDGNFEQTYSRIAVDPNLSEVCAKLEREIREYFADLELPEHPTVYDHLLLSLRKKDVIATFNWDPFLIQAYRRNSHFCELPSIYFLHGSVAAGYCPTHITMGSIGHPCSECGKPFVPSRLLYPIEKKSYNDDSFIKAHWEDVQYFLKHSFLFTAFGYGAPASDVEAVSLLKNSWTKNSGRQVLQCEIIDKKCEAPVGKEEIEQRWNPFFYSHHYQLMDCFSQSYIAKHPRRSCEAMHLPIAMGRFPPRSLPIPTSLSFDALYSWLEPIVTGEKAGIDQP